MLVLAKFNFGDGGGGAAGEKENVKVEKREGSRQEFKARSQPTNVYFDHPKIYGSLSQQQTWKRSFECVHVCG